MQAVRLRSDALEAGDFVQADQVVGGQQVLLHQHNGGGAAGDRPAIVLVLVQQSQGLVETGGGVEVEISHGLAGLSGVLNRLDDLVIAGAAAEVAHHPVAIVFGRRIGQGDLAAMIWPGCRRRTGKRRR
jgi:hypothetical protein